MINLIPKEEKKKIVRGFYYKLIVLFFLMTGVIFTIATITVLPSYFLSSVKSNLINTKLATQKAEPVPVPDQETMGAIKDLNNKLGIIEATEKNKFTVSNNIITDILLKKTTHIQITDISYLNNATNAAPSNGKVTIQGIAPSRDVLLSFRDALEQDPTFKAVDLPVSNFVKGSDIQFSLTLTPS